MVQVPQECLDDAVQATPNAPAGRRSSPLELLQCLYTSLSVEDTFFFADLVLDPVYRPPYCLGPFPGGAAFGGLLAGGDLVRRLESNLVGFQGQNGDFAGSVCQRVDWASV